MKKIALISSVPPPMGGIAKWTLRMLNSNLNKGWTIELVNDQIVGGRECFGDKVKYNYWAELKRWLNVWKTLFKTARKKDVKIAHACPIATVTSMSVNIVSALVVKMCGKKHIVHFRCTVPNLVKTRFQLILLKILCRLSDKIICLNTQTSEFLKQHSKTPTILIPNFVDVAEIVPIEVRPQIKTAVYVGGVTKEKGCCEIIDVAKRCPDILFKLVGLASSEVKDYAQGVTNVKFVGVKSGEDLTRELVNSDVFFFLSKFWGEGFSNALSEAMAVGLPCIVTDWAANADQVDDTIGGYVVRENVVLDAAESLKRMQSPMTREEMSKYNVEKVKNQYSASRILDQYVECYEELTSYD